MYHWSETSILPYISAWNLINHLNPRYTLKGFVSLITVFFNQTQYGASCYFKISNLKYLGRQCSVLIFLPKRAYWQKRGPAHGDIYKRTSQEFTRSPCSFQVPDPWQPFPGCLKLSENDTFQTVAGEQQKALPMTANYLNRLNATLAWTAARYVTGMTSIFLSGSTQQ